jgi:HEAT repeat protein
VEALGLWGDPRAISALNNVLESDRDMMVRKAAHVALQQLGE